MIKTWHAFAAVAGAALAVSVAGCGKQSTTVRVGVVSAVSDAAFFIADKKGYFRDEGLDVQLVSFDSGAKMVAPLGAGQLEVAAGSASAGLYNAIARDIRIKIVADKGSTPPGYGFQPLLVRKDLVESGRYKTLADLKGMKIAGSATGSASTSTLNEALKTVGLTSSDVERLYLSFPQHIMALENKAVDAALTTEPSATEAVQRGVAVRVMGDDEIYPDHQLSVVLYSGRFIEEQRDVALRFMTAYLRAVRDYRDALADGKLRGPRAGEVIDILTEYTNVKDPEVYRAITPQGTDADGKLNRQSLERDLAFYRSEGLIEGNVSVDQAIDTSFAEAAVKELGPYRPMTAAPAAGTP
jgi:NitT/TauT family transport system substrate-binding protein